MGDSEELAKLGELHQRGVLTDEEFARAKARVLSGSAAGNGSAGQRAPAAEVLQVLRRSREDRWIGGVCGGIAKVTGAPSWVWRLVFAILFVCAGTGGVFYILLWIFVPQEPAPGWETRPASH
jgi:phage shock protein PspC (stress-responsive transcriptional regulator)